MDAGKPSAAAMAAAKQILGWLISKKSADGQLGEMLASIIDRHYANTADAIMQRDDWPKCWWLAPALGKFTWTVWECPAFVEEGAPDQREVATGPTPAAACRAALETLRAAGESP